VESDQLGRGITTARQENYIIRMRHLTIGQFNGSAVNAEVALQLDSKSYFDDWSKDVVTGMGIVSVIDTVLDNYHTYARIIYIA
jgi:hypothetical protein